MPDPPPEPYPFKALPPALPYKAPRDEGATDMDIGSEGVYLPDIIKRIDPSAMTQRLNVAVEAELRLLGEKLVREVYKNTPKGTGTLASSTKYRITSARKTIGADPEWKLEIIQDATSKQQGAVDPGKRYFYWYTVHHGIQPDGRLKRVRPPFNREGTLFPWVQKVVPTLDPEYTTSAIAWNIYKFGLRPNPYLRISYMNKQMDINETSSKIAQAVIFDLNDLPDIEHNYSGRQRGF